VSILVGTRPGKGEKENREETRIKKKRKEKKSEEKQRRKSKKKSSGWLASFGISLTVQNLCFVHIPNICCTFFCLCFHTWPFIPHLYLLFRALIFSPTFTHLIQYLGLDYFISC
jgi:hypothetical protein